MQDHVTSSVSRDVNLCHVIEKKNHIIMIKASLRKGNSVLYSLDGYDSYHSSKIERIKIK